MGRDKRPGDEPSYVSFDEPEAVVPEVPARPSAPLDDGASYVDFDAKPAVAPPSAPEPATRQPEPADVASYIVEEDRSAPERPAVEPLPDDGRQYISVRGEGEFQVEEAPPEPADRGLSRGAVWLLQGGAAVVVLALVGLVTLLALGTGWVKESRSTLMAKRSAFHVAVESERAVIDQIALLGGDRQVLEDLYFQYEDAGAADKVRTAKAFSEGLEVQLAACDQTLRGYRLAEPRVRKVSDAREGYEEAIVDWTSTSRGPVGWLVLTFGLADGL